jgi:Galactose oxidase, central domain
MFLRVLIAFLVSSTVLVCKFASANSVLPVSPLSQPTIGHTATLLADGRVLVVDPSGRSERFDPLSNVWTVVQSAGIGTWSHQTARLSDGRVWLGGGTTNAGASSARTELYSPTSDTWTTGFPLSVARSQFSATRLADGRVIVVGGGTLTSGSPQTVHASTEIVGLDGSSIVNGPTLPAARWKHTATLLPNGDLIVLGGLNASDQRTDTCFRLVNGASVFISCASIPFARADHRAILLGDGKVLVLGGVVAGQSGFESVYDPAINAWSATKIPVSAATNFAVAARNGNSAVIWGGTVPQSSFSNPTQPKRYFWPQDQLGVLFWLNSQPTALSTIGSHTATELVDGRTLIAGGSTEFGCVIGSGLGCIAYGELATANAYMVDRAVAQMIYRASDGELPANPEVGERYRATGWIYGNWNPNPGVAVTISDGTASCVTNAPATSCLLTTIVAGPKQYTWTFEGDSEYLPTSVTAARPSSATVRIERVGQQFSYVEIKYAAATKYCGLRLPVVYITDCDVDVPPATQLTLTANAYVGDTFVGWQGACAGTSATCTAATLGAGSVVARAVFAPTSALPLTLDIDNDATANALGDGQLIRRFMSRVHDAALTQGALGTNAQLSAPDAIEERLNVMVPLLDLDQNGRADPKTDGVMILRFLLGFRGDALTQGALGQGARRTDATQIATHLQSLMP